MMIRTLLIFVFLLCTTIQVNAQENKPFFQYCVDASFSPGDNEFAFISNLSGDAQIWKKPTGNQWPEQISNVNGQVRHLLWNPVKAIIAFSVAVGGSDNRVIYLMKPDGSGIQQITNNHQISRLQAWSKDGEKLFFSTRQDGAKGVNLYSYSLSTQGTKRHTSSDYYESIEDVNHGDILFWQLFQRSKENLLLLEGGGTSVKKIITHEEGIGTIKAATLLKNGSVIAATDMYSNRHALVVIPKTGDKKVVYSKEDADLVDINLSPNGELIFAHWKTYGISKFEILSSQSFEVLFSPSLPLGTIFRNTWTNNSQAVAFQFVGDANNIYLFDVVSNQLSKQTFCQRTTLEENSYQTELHKFQSFDGLELDGWLKRAGKDPAPTVIYFHGGPEGESSYSGIADMDQRLLDAGINVFYPNIRGSTGRGKIFVTLDNKAKRWDAIKDVKAIYDYLVNKKIARKNAIAVMGGSYGGYMTNASLAFYPDLFVTGISMYGISDFTKNRSWFSHLSSEEYGHPKNDAELLRALSPITSADSIKSPMLFVHGANDTNTPVTQSTDLKNILDKNGVETSILIFDDEGHGIVKRKNREMLNAHILDWLIKHLSVNK